MIWGEKVNEFYRNKLVAAPFFTDRSDEVSGGGDTLYTPNTTEFTASAKATGVAVTLNSNSDTKQTLNINSWFEASFGIEDAEAAQVKRSYSLMERYSKNVAYAIAKKLDTAIVTLFATFTNAVGSSLNTLGDSDIRAAFAYLETAGADVMESAWFVSPNVNINASSIGDNGKKTIEIAGNTLWVNPQPSPYWGRFRDYNNRISIEMKG